MECCSVCVAYGGAYMVCGSARAALGTTVCSVASGRAVCGHVGGRAVCGVAGGACTEFVGIACSNGKFVSTALSPVSDKCENKGNVLAE